MSIEIMITTKDNIRRHPSKSLEAKHWSALGSNDTQACHEVLNGLRLCLGEARMLRNKALKGRQYRKLRKGVN